MRKQLLLLSIFTVGLLAAKAQMKVGDQPTIQQKAVALDVQGSDGRQGIWLPRVTDTTNTGINGLNPPDGLIIYHWPSRKLMVRSNNAWVSFLENAIQSITAGGATHTGPALTYNTGTAGSDFNISSTTNNITWNLPDASTVARGAVTKNAQTFGGAKTFADGVTVNNGSTLNGGTTANGGLNVQGNTANASNLTLGITSATAPGTSTDRYLTVDAAGKVTLNTIPATGVTSITAGGVTMSGPDVAFITGTAGTNLNFTSSGNTTTLNLPDASTTARGAVTNAAQTFGGAKTFANGATVNNGLTVNNSSTLNNGATANGGLTVTGATTNTSNLTLGITSATTPGAQTDRYLTVDNTGKVSLNDLKTISNITAGGTLLTGTSVSFVTGTSGSDFAISSAGSIATFNLPDAGAGARGVVNTGAQTFNGQKTFNTGATVSGAVSNASNLTLGIKSTTAPGAQTDRYLTVDATGKVTLNTVNQISTVTAGGNTMTGPGLTFQTANAGTDFSISTVGNVATWNLPNAATTVTRGVITNVAQTIGGNKTFNDSLIVNNGANIMGAVSGTSRLKIGVTSNTTPDSVVNKFLSVDNAGNVIVASPTPGVFGPTRVICFSATPVEMSTAILKVDKDDGVTLTFNLTLPAGVTLSNPATVTMSPEVAIHNKIGINWAVVTGPSQITASIASNNGGKWDFRVGFKFYITVTMF